MDTRTPIGTPVRRIAVASILVAGFAAFAVAKSPGNNDISESAAAAPAPSETVAPARPAPGVLSRSIEARGFWFGSRAENAAPPEPLHITTPKPLVQLEDSAEGFRPQKNAWARVDGSIVNLRAAPGIDSPRIGQLRQGTRVKVLERNATWVRIEIPDSTISGWMHGDYLLTVGNKS